MQKSASWISSGYALCVVDLLKEKKNTQGHLNFPINSLKVKANTLSPFKLQKSYFLWSSSVI